MNAEIENEPGPVKNRTTVERTSEREVDVTRTFNGPARIVFEAWTTPELFRHWTRFSSPSRDRNECFRAARGPSQRARR